MIHASESPRNISFDTIERINICVGCGLTCSYKRCCNLGRISRIVNKSETLYRILIFSLSRRIYNFKITVIRSNLNRLQRMAGGIVNFKRTVFYRWISSRIRTGDPCRGCKAAECDRRTCNRGEDFFKCPLHGFLLSSSLLGGSFFFPDT